MTATKNSPTKITVTKILNESMLDDATFYATQSGCNYEQLCHATKGIVTGTEKQIKKFIELWNK